MYFRETPKRLQKCFFQITTFIFSVNFLAFKQNKIEFQIQSFKFMLLQRRKYEVLFPSASSVVSP